MTSLEAITGAILATAIGYIGAYATHTYCTTDTADWFTSSLDAPTLEIGERGTGETVNPQETVDAAELQGGE